MSNLELSKIYAGSVSTTLLNTVIRFITFAYELGRSLGTTISKRRK